MSDEVFSLDRSDAHERRTAVQEEEKMFHPAFHRGEHRAHVEAVLKGIDHPGFTGPAVRGRVED